MCSIEHHEYPERSIWPIGRVYSVLLCAVLVPECATVTEGEFYHVLLRPRVFFITRIGRRILVGGLLNSGFLAF